MKYPVASFFLRIAVICSVLCGSLLLGALLDGSMPAAAALALLVLCAGGGFRAARLEKRLARIRRPAQGQRGHALRVVSGAKAPVQVA